MLYWAEGGKSRNVVQFTNSDADMVSLFLLFLRRCFGLSDDRIALSVNCYLGNGLTLPDIERWWLSRLGLPRESLRRSHVGSPTKQRAASRRVLRYGTVRLTVCSTAITQHIYGAIQEYAGLSGARWID